MYLASWLLSLSISLCMQLDQHGWLIHLLLLETSIIYDSTLSKKKEQRTLKRQLCFYALNRRHLFIMVERNAERKRERRRPVVMWPQSWCPRASESVEHHLEMFEGEEAPKNPIFLCWRGTEARILKGGKVKISRTLEKRGYVILNINERARDKESSASRKYEHSTANAVHGTNTRLQNAIGRSKPSNFQR